MKHMQSQRSRLFLIATGGALAGLNLVSVLAAFAAWILLGRRSPPHERAA